MDPAMHPTGREQPNLPSGTEPQTVPCPPEMPQRIDDKENTGGRREGRRGPRNPLGEVPPLMCNVKTDQAVQSKTVGCAVRRAWFESMTWREFAGDWR